MRPAIDLRRARHDEERLAVLLDLWALMRLARRPRWRADAGRTAPARGAEARRRARRGRSTRHGRVFAPRRRPPRSRCRARAGRRRRRSPRPRRASGFLGSRGTAPPPMRPIPVPWSCPRSDAPGAYGTYPTNLTKPWRFCPARPMRRRPRGRLFRGEAPAPTLRPRSFFRAHPRCRTQPERAQALYESGPRADEQRPSSRRVLASALGALQHRIIFPMLSFPYPWRGGVLDWARLRSESPLARTERRPGGRRHGISADLRRAAILDPARPVRFTEGPARQPQTRTKATLPCAVKRLWEVDPHLNGVLPTDHVIVDHYPPDRMLPHDIASLAARHNLYGFSFVPLVTFKCAWLALWIFCFYALRYRQSNKDAV